MTNDGVTHDDARDALAALGLDALDSGEREVVLSHVATCDACRAELDALRASAAELSYGVPSAKMSPERRDRIRARLVARASADRTPVPEHNPTASYQILVPHGGQQPHAHLAQHWMSSPASWIAMAATIVAVVSVTTLLQVSRERDTVSAAYQMVATNEKLVGPAVLDSLHTVIEDRDRMIANLTGPQVAVVTLAATGAQPISARMFWDQAVNAWTFIAHNMPKPKSGRTYQLWLVTANQKISAGTFTPSANGDAVVRATYSLPKDALAAVAVTDEPSEGSSQPTTVPFIAGTKSAR